MLKTLAVMRRELITYFSSPLAYLVLTAFLFAQGLTFYFVIAFIPDPVTQLQAFFGGTFLFWIILLFVVPVITMRLIAEERRSGTLEVLLTAPLTETHIIGGKFLAALIFYIVLWLPTGCYPLILSRHTELDPGPVLAGYFGILLVGFLLLSIGTFASTLTSNQLIAAIVAFAALFVVLMAPFAEHLVTSGSLLKAPLAYMNLSSHMEDFAMGIIDTRHVVYELSVGLAFLFFAVRSLEMKKGR